MKLRAFLLSFFTALYASGCATYPAYKEADFDIEFGILKKTPDGVWQVEPSLHIPYIIGESNQKFGYKITPTKTSNYTFYGVAHMPSNPLILEGHVVSTISQASNGDGIKSILVNGNGIDVMDAWLTAGDPKGEYSMQLYINGSLAADTDFVIE